MFIQQKARSQQPLHSLQQKPLAPNYLISAIQAELTNLGSIYTSYKPLILTATQLLKREPSFSGMSPFSKHAKRSLLPFLRDSLSWLTRTAMTKDVKDIKKRINQLDVDFSYCWLNLEVKLYSLEQYIGLIEDKLSSTTVDFFRSEGYLETKCLYWIREPKKC